MDKQASGMLLKRQLRYEGARAVVQEAKKGGKLPEGWQEISFSDAVHLNPTVKLTKGNRYPFVDMKSLNPACREVVPNEMRTFQSGGARFLPQDTLLARITPCLENGKIARYNPIGTNREAFGSTEFIVIRGKDGVTDNDFVYYLAIWPEFRKFAISQMTGSSGRQRVPVGSLAGFTFNLPPLPEQKAIAHILGSLDDKIELNRRMNETLEAMAQALFKSWFVDFDPVIDNALAAGNPIPDELKEKAAIRQELGDKQKSLPKDIRRLFPSEFAYTEEMGWVPKGWKVSKVGQEVGITGGGTPNKKDESFWSEGANAFCTPKDMSVSPSKILLKTQFQLTDKGVSKVSSGQLSPGAVLISSRAPIGYLVITNLPVTINQGIIAMLKQDQFSELFLFCWAKCNMNEMLSRANGSTFLEINKKNFRTIPFLVPSKEILTTFNNLTNEFIVRITSCSKETQSLRFFRDSLLSKLLAGEIRMQKTDKLLEEVK